MRGNKRKFILMFIVSIVLTFTFNNVPVVALESKEMVVNNTKTFSTDGFSIEKIRAAGQNSFVNVFQVYLKAGESFKFTATYGGSDFLNEAAVVGKYNIVDPNGASQSIDYPKGTSNATSFVPDATDGVQSITVTASEDGVYAVTQAYESGKDTFHTLNFNVENAAGEYQSGRVWSNNIHLQSSWRINTSTTGKFKELDDYTFYHVTSTGYVYNQTLNDFNGISATINSDPVGILDKREGNCSPFYGDSPYWATTIYEPLSANAECSNRIQANNLFLEIPDSTLPEEAEVLKIGNDGKVVTDASGNIVKEKRFIVPKIENNVPETKTIDFKRDVYYENKGTFELDIVNAQGFVTLIISIDDDKDGVEDRAVEKEVLVNENGITTYYWDGLDDNDVQVPIDSELSASVKISKAGEIHFLLTDVETIGAQSVKKVTSIEAENVGDGSVYYNSSTLPLDTTNAKNVSLPNPTFGKYDSSTNTTLRAWDSITHSTNKDINTVATRLTAYEGMPTAFTPATNPDPTTNTASLGDGNLMQVWAYETVNIISTRTMLPVYNPNVTIEKASDITVAKVGDDITYFIKVKNNENFEVVNYNVTDTLNALDRTEYNIDSITVDGLAKTDAIDEDNVSYENGVINVDFANLAANQEVIIGFKITILPNAAGTQIYNIAVLNNPEEPEIVTESNKVVIEVINKPVTTLPQTGQNDLTLVILLASTALLIYISKKKISKVK